MLVLVATESLTVDTSSAADIDIHVSYMVLSGTTPSTQLVTPGSQNTAFTSATTKTILSAPSAGTWINTKVITFRNKHAATSCDITLKHLGVSATVEVKKETLIAGAEMHYVDGVGFTVL